MDKILRWTKFRKAMVLQQIDANPTQAHEIMALHDLSLEEITEWRKALAAYGIESLRATRLQHYQKSRTKIDASLYARLRYRPKAPTK